MHRAMFDPRVVGLALFVLGAGCVDTSAPRGPRADASVAAADAAVDGGGCAAGLTWCDQSCVDVGTSTMHCGECGAACGAGQVCSNGRCLDECPPLLTECSGTCVDTVSDPAHCDGCGRACAAGGRCIASECQCLDGAMACDGVCVDVQNSTSHCGGCGRACSSGQICAAGECVACGATTSFAADVQPILTAACASAACHAGHSPAANLTLEEGAAYAAMVNVPSSCADGRAQVEPGDPDASYLIHKIDGVMLCGGTRMPLAGRNLPSEQVAIIRDWICGGALDN